MTNFLLIVACFCMCIMIGARAEYLYLPVSILDKSSDEVKTIEFLSQLNPKEQSTVYCQRVATLYKELRKKGKLDDADILMIARISEHSLEKKMTRNFGNSELTNIYKDVTIKLEAKSKQTTINYLKITNCLEEKGKGNQDIIQFLNERRY